MLIQAKWFCSCRLWATDVSTLRNPHAVALLPCRLLPVNSAMPCSSTNATF